jgi:hypothetical protein
LVLSKDNKFTRFPWYQRAEKRPIPGRAPFLTEQQIAELYELVVEGPRGERSRWWVPRPPGRSAGEDVVIAVRSMKSRRFWKVKRFASDNCQGLPLVEALVLESDWTCVRLVKPGDNVENGGLPSSLGSDEAGYATSLDGKTAIVQNLQTADTDLYPGSFR